MFGPLFLLILIPIVEFTLLAKTFAALSRVYDPGSALLLVLGTLLLGATIGKRVIRSGGFDLMGRVQASFARGEAPGEKILDSFMLFLAGAAFIFPGYVSDLVGLLLLIPWLRRLAGRLLISWGLKKARSGNLKVYHTMQAPRPQSREWQADAGVIDVEFQDQREAPPSLREGPIDPDRRS